MLSLFKNVKLLLRMLPLTPLLCADCSKNTTRYFPPELFDKQWWYESLTQFIFINCGEFLSAYHTLLQIHYSKQGQAFKSRAVSMQVEILQSPWLYELMALHVNLREAKANMGSAPLQLDGFNLIFDSTKPSLSFELFDTISLNIELTCSICLVSKVTKADN